MAFLMYLAILLLLAMLGLLATIHAYWGMGGRWPGRNESSLVALVVGRTKDMRMPSPAACFAVATALATTAIMVILHMPIISNRLSDFFVSLIAIGYWSAAFAFLLRGFAGYVPMIWRHAKGTPFYRFNQIYYSPLCLVIALGFIFCR